MAQTNGEADVAAPAVGFRLRPQGRGNLRDANRADCAELRHVDLADVVLEEVRPDDDVVEAGSIGAKRYLVVGSFIQVIPRHRVQFSLGQPGKVKDICLLEQLVAELAVFPIRLEKWGCS